VLLLPGKREKKRITPVPIPKVKVKMFCVVRIIPYKEKGKGKGEKLVKALLGLPGGIAGTGGRGGKDDAMAVFVLRWWGGGGREGCVGATKNLACSKGEESGLTQTLLQPRGERKRKGTSVPCRLHLGKS